MSANNVISGQKRLDSWKEIAAFFDRDERTVNRWEKELGLPIHRLPGTKGRVYAYSEELSAWLAASAIKVGSVQPEVPQPVSLNGTNLNPTAPAVALPASLKAGLRNEARNSKSVRATNLVRLAAVMGVAAVALAFIILYPSARRSPLRAVRPPLPTQPASLGAVALASSPPHDPAAEQLYLKGRYYWNKRTPDDLNKALDYFMQAVVHDPTYSQAYVGMADCYNLMREYTLMPSSEAFPRALAAAKKAVELDDQSSEAHASLAFTSFFGMWDVATGEREFRRAIDLNPNLAASHHWYANALLALTRYSEALQEIDRAQALDPGSTSILADKGNILFRAGRREEGLSLLKQMESREPSFRSPHGYLKGSYLTLQDYPNYLIELRKDAQLVHDEAEIAVANAAAKGFASGGSRGMFAAMLPVQKERNAQGAIAATEVARTYAALGDKENALRYLNTAYQQREGEMLFIQVFGEFSPLHDDPAYRDLLARMNLPPQN